MEAAPRRAALRGGLRLATGKVVVYVVDRVIRSTRRDRECVRVLLLIGFGGDHHESGLDGDSPFAEWMSTLAKNARTHGSWKRMRCDECRHSTIAARVVKYQSAKNIATGARRMRRLPCRRMPRPLFSATLLDDRARASRV